MEVTAVVPTLGRSPWLAECLAALRREGGAGMEIVVVDQGERPAEIPPGLADRVLRPGRNLGFAGGVNLGIAEGPRAAESAGIVETGGIAETAGTAGRARAVETSGASGGIGEAVALVNDDALVEPGWLAALTAALAAAPRAAAAQGVNLQLDRPELADGCGLGWNRSWQAVQLGTGAPAPAPSELPREVFGVSATAALYRREALAAAALPGGEVFDARLGSYYEDVDLAARLRAAGWTSLLVPAARARHAGSTTGRTLGRARWASIYGNRHLVLARLLGAGYWSRLPRLLARDGRDLARALLVPRDRDGRLAGIPAGWGRAVRHLPAYARRGAPAVPLAELERFRITSPRTSPR